MGLPALLCFSVLHLRYISFTPCVLQMKRFWWPFWVWRPSTLCHMASILCHCQIFHLVCFRSPLLLRNLWIVVIMWYELLVGNYTQVLILCPLIEGLNEILESQYTFCPRVTLCEAENLLNNIHCMDWILEKIVIFSIQQGNIQCLRII